MSKAFHYSMNYKFLAVNINDILTVLGASGGALALIVGYFKNKNDNETQLAIKRIEKDFDDLKEDNLALAESVKKLKTQLIGVKSENTKLRVRVKALENDNEEKDDKILKLKNENKELKGKLGEQ